MILKVPQENQPKSTPTSLDSWYGIVADFVAIVEVVNYDELQ
jgi:hypothetical protein